MKEGSRLPSFLFRAVRYRRPVVEVIDQTRLPDVLKRLRVSSAAGMVAAISRLAVRGAPAIGVAAAYALAAEAWRLPDNRLRAGLRRAARMLAVARPTAVNLAWSVARVMEAAKAEAGAASAVRRTVEHAAEAIEMEETKRSIAMARAGVGLVPKNGVVLTICNTGALAAPGMGTALGVVFQAHLQGRRPRVFVCETRPLLQGARLTMLELQRAEIPATLIVEGAAASVIGRCDLVLVGADRVAANGDTANKVGTMMLATLARSAGVPFYVVAPSSTFDLSIGSGGGIRIEERNESEVTGFGACRSAPKGARAFNPAFDLTPARLVTGLVTERGIIRPPFRSGIRRALGR